jgi:guanylate kinase
MEADQRPRRGIIFILSGPSGAGKTSILSPPALKAIGGLETSISLTTRAPREGEVDGFDYHFVSDEEFKSRVGRSELAEWVSNFDASYGTPREPLDRAVASGGDIVLDIDIEGARKIREAYPDDTVTIFVLPPSFAELEERLRRRGTENEAAITRRLRRASEESSAYPEYDYIIINADIEASISHVGAVVKAERLKVSRLREGFAQWKI